jgi:hypothetical protein
MRTWDVLGGSAMHHVRIGTGGWSYKDWSGVFYPDDLAASVQLSYLGERYPVVEGHSTFYRSPSHKAVEGWRDRTPPGFGFSLKVPQAITHEKVLLDCGADVDSFLAAARLLGEKLLCCPLRFGYFNRRNSPRWGPSSTASTPSWRAGRPMCRLRWRCATRHG